MMSPKISVVMASYNHAPFVGEAVSSVLGQSYDDIELVVTDDGSSDGTVEAIRRYEDPRLHLEVLPANQGASLALNNAIGRARGEYVAVLNSDDFFLPGKLQRQVDYLEAHPEIGAVFGLPLCVDERGEPLTGSNHAFQRIFVQKNQPRQGWLRHFFLFGNSLCHPTIMVRRSCYQKVGVLNPLLRQLPDLDLWIRLCRAYDIHILPEKLTGFRLLGQERNTSAPLPANLARAAWEMPVLLAHYRSLDETEMRAVFPEAVPGQDIRLVLARAAIEVGRPGYTQFGLALLREVLETAPGAFSVNEYFSLVGKTDPYGAASFHPQPRSRMAARLRSLATRLRSRLP